MPIRPPHAQSAYRLSYRTTLINQYPPRQTRSAAVIGHKSQTMDPKVSSDWLYSFQGWNASAARKASIALQRHGDWSHHCGFAPTSEIRLSDHYRVHTTHTTACPCLGSPSAIRHMGFPTVCAGGCWGTENPIIMCARRHLRLLGAGWTWTAPSSVRCARDRDAGREGLCILYSL
jgi:hypothetical protein